MHYPWWYVPHLTAPMLIAVVSVVHVLVSHYAVGGGLFLAVETGHAYRTRDREYLDYLHGHAAFFILLTVVFGAITGVGIWWTIGLSSPLATETLIRTFVFGWATEWVFFVIELVSAFIFLYYWGRLSENKHIAIGWIYATAAWISLVLITGITAFMLNSGRWAMDPAAQNFWSAFFNPQFIPQTVARTGGALLLGSLYVYLHTSIFIRGERLRNLIASRSARPALLGAIMIATGGVAWYLFLPEAAQATLVSSAVMNVFTGVLLSSTLVVLVMIILGPYLNPGWLSPGFAGLLCLFGVAAFAAGEFVREAIRKPYVIHNVVLSNQVLPEQVAELQKNGYLNGGVWPRAFIAERFPQVTADDRIDNKILLELPSKDRILVGEVIYQHHCNDCHAARLGYSAVGPLLQNRSREQVLATVLHLNDNYSMPPWCGTKEEAELLADYLTTIMLPRPAGIRPWEKSGSDSANEESGGKK
ncbi:MAG: cytochrome ubiquinol oxidase subunit I [Pirellulales bacterium]|nr:cytochrome ubiquinol oxidase subunit I [Pirellulales bacterium]